MFAVIGIVFCFDLFAKGCHIMKRHCDMSLLWKDTWLHRLLSQCQGIRFSRAMTGGLAMAVCACAIVVNPQVQQIQPVAKAEQTELKNTEKVDETVVDSKEVNKKDSARKVEEVKAETESTEKKEEEVKDKTELMPKPEEQKSEEVAVKETKPSAWKNIDLCETVSPHKTYMDDVMITARYSEQWKLFNEAKYGEVVTDDIGFQYIEGVDPDTGEPMKFYTVALGTYYLSHIGEKFRVTMANGFQFGVITGDIKSDAHTHAGNNTANVKAREGHNINGCLAGSNDMLEFIIDAEKMKTVYPGANGLANNGSMNRDFDGGHQFSGAVAKIEVLAES